MSVFVVELTDEATPRAKSRIKQFGPVFDEVELRENSKLTEFSGLPTIRLRNHLWNGWLLQSDVVVTEVETSSI